MRGVVGLRCRAELRRGWATWLVLAVLGAVAAGATMAVAAGARRTDSAPDRFAAAQRSPDVVVPNYPDAGAAQLDPEAMAAVDGVAASARFLWQYWTIGDDGAALVLPRDDAFGTTIGVPRFVAGRAADPAAVGEVTASHDLAERFDLQVGDVLRGFDDATIPLVEEAGLPIDLTVVGIEARPFELGQAHPAILALHGTPALYERWHEVEPERVDGVIVRLEAGTGVDAYVAALRDLATDAPVVPSFDEEEAAADPAGGYVFVVTDDSQSAELDRTANLLADGSWVLAAVLGLAGAALLYAAHARSAAAGADELRRLRALGWTQRETVATAVTRSAAIGALSVLPAAALAAALSPLFPVGLAAVAEPDPGVRLDGLVLSAGAALTVVITVAVGTLAGVRAERAAEVSADRAVGRLVGWSPIGSLGARFAFARGATGVARVMLGTVTALAVLAGLASFVGGADRVLAAPRTYGSPWELVAERYEEGQLAALDSTEARDAIAGLDGVAAVAVGDSVDESSLSVEGRSTGGFLLDVVRGDPEAALPPILAGRAPIQPGEVALGPNLMDRFELEVGDTVTVEGDQRGEFDLIVTGSVVIPPGVAGQPGEGVLLPRTPTEELTGVADAPQAVFVVLDGADPGAVLDELNDRLGAAGPDRLFVRQRSEPEDLAHLLRTSSIPALLLLVLAVLAAGSLISALIGVTVSRARDIAILRAIGLYRRAADRVLLWQAVCLVAAGLIVTVPLGVAAGRWAWIRYAEAEGFVPVGVTPWVAVAVGVAGALVVAVATVWPAARLTSARPPGRQLVRD